MKRLIPIWLMILPILLISCTTSYQAKPLPFKSPNAYQNTVVINGAQVGGQAYVEKRAAQSAFGFDIRGAGMLPVQVVFDNQSPNALEINPGQTFLEDAQGNLWPVLTDRFAYERATKYAQTKKIFKEGAYSGFLGATTGAIIGAAVGIVSGNNVGEALGKGAAVGAAAGSVMGGAQGAATARDARRAIVSDLKDKSLENKTISPGNLAHGIIFFPGEAASAKQLRLQLKEIESGRLHTVFLKF